MADPLSIPSVAPTNSDTPRWELLDRKADPEAGKARFDQLKEKARAELHAPRQSVEPNPEAAEAPSGLHVGKSARAIPGLEAEIRRQMGQLNFPEPAKAPNAEKPRPMTIEEKVRAAKDAAGIK